MDSARAAVRVDARDGAAIGRRARLELTFECRRGRTVLAHAYAEPPFHVGRMFEVDPGAQLILVCSGPGIFAGDRLEQHVRVRAGARVAIVSQSALQVHPSPPAAPAELESTFEVDADAGLDCFWDPLIPFARSRLRQSIQLSIASGAQLFWSDAFVSGRAGSGETWQFETIDHTLRLAVDGALRYLERYRISPRDGDLTHSWITRHATYVGTTLMAGDEATDACATEAQRRVGGSDCVRAGVDCVAPGLLLARLLAAQGPQFAAARSILRDACGRPPIRRGV